MAESDGLLILRQAFSQVLVVACNRFFGKQLLQFSNVAECACLFIKSLLRLSRQPVFSR